MINGVTYIDPTITSFTSQNAYALDRPAVSIVNGAGLTLANGQHSITPDGTPAPGDGYMWMGGPIGVDPYPIDIVFNLGAIYNLQKVHVWNFNEPEDINGYLGVKNVDISTSVNNILYSAPVPYVFSPATGLSTDTGLDYALATGLCACCHGCAVREIQNDVQLSH